MRAAVAVDMVSDLSGLEIGNVNEKDEILGEIEER